MSNWIADLKKISTFSEYVASLSRGDKSALMVALVSDYARTACETSKKAAYHDQLLNLVNNWFR